MAKPEMAVGVVGTDGQSIVAHDSKEESGRRQSTGVEQTRGDWLDQQREATWIVHTPEEEKGSLVWNQVQEQAQSLALSKHNPWLCSR